jgi:hypothetical protein
VVFIIGQWERQQISSVLEVCIKRVANSKCTLKGDKASAIDEELESAFVE